MVFKDNESASTLDFSVSNCWTESIALQSIAIDEMASSMDHDVSPDSPIHAKENDSSDMCVKDTNPDPEFPNTTADPEINDDSSSTVSQADTDIFHHEPFEDFHPKVIALCGQLWPDKVGCFSVEKMCGGNNRVMGITIQPPKLKKTLDPTETSTVLNSLIHETDSLALSPGDPQRYVLRMPWDEFDRDLEQEECHLRFFARLTPFAVTTTYFSNFTKDNIVARPYTIHGRVPGECLENLWPKLSHVQSCMWPNRLPLFFAHFLSINLPMRVLLIPYPSPPVTPRKLRLR